MNKIFSIALLLVIILSVAGCGPDPVCPEEIGFVGNYDGEHVVTIPSIGIPLPTNDSLFVTNPVEGDNQLSGQSQTLNTTLNCRISSSNCKAFTIDTVYIDSTKVSGITIKNVVAAGNGDIDGNKLVTRITIISGMAYDIPVYGNQDLAGTRINGLFYK